MRTRRMLVLLALLGAGAAVAPLAAPPRGAGPDAVRPAAPAAVPVVVYYFHGRQRCRTCMKIEAIGESTVVSRFGKELKDRRIEWRVVDFDKPENEHVITEYGLVTQSIVLVEYRDGKQLRFKNLAKVWRLAADDQALEAYIRDELREFLRGVHA